MNKTIPTIIALSALTFALGACSEQREYHMAYQHPGSYESTETTTDAKGTTTVKQSSTVITVDEDGNRKETITSKITRDPEGLGNKTTKRTSRTIEQK